MRVTDEDIKKFLQESGIGESTQKSYGYVLDGFLKQTNELSEDSVRDFVNGYGEVDSSRNTALQIIKSFSKWLHSKTPPVGEENQMKRFELEKISDIKPKKTVTKVEKKGVEMGELEEIFKGLDGLPFSGIWCLFYFGCRPGELVGLEPSMIGDGEVTFLTEKTYVERPIPFSEFTGKQLEDFVNSGFKYQYLWKRCKEVGITPKAGRQTFRTQMDHRLADLGVRPVRGDLLIKLAQGHTISKDMAGVYADYREDLEKLFLDWHYMKNLEEKIQE